MNKIQVQLSTISKKIGRMFGPPLASVPQSDPPRLFLLLVPPAAPPVRSSCAYTCPFLLCAPKNVGCTRHCVYSTVFPLLPQLLPSPLPWVLQPALNVRPNLLKAKSFLVFLLFLLLISLQENLGALGRGITPAQKCNESQVYTLSTKESGGAGHGG